jgi:hypothetical protein
MSKHETLIGQGADDGGATHRGLSSLIVRVAAGHKVKIAPLRDVLLALLATDLDLLLLAATTKIVLLEPLGLVF